MFERFEMSLANKQRVTERTNLDLRSKKRQRARTMRIDGVRNVPIGSSPRVASAGQPSPEGWLAQPKLPEERGRSTTMAGLAEPKLPEERGRSTTMDGLAEPKLPEERGRSTTMDGLAEPKLPEENGKPKGSEGWRPHGECSRGGRASLAPWSQAVRVAPRR
jgi:hypothetical protein